MKHKEIYKEYQEGKISHRFLYPMPVTNYLRTIGQETTNIDAF